MVSSCTVSTNDLPRSVKATLRSERNKNGPNPIFSRVARGDRVVLTNQGAPRHNYVTAALPRTARFSGQGSCTSYKGLRTKLSGGCADLHEGEMEEKLINLVRGAPALYDKSSEGYHMKDAKNNTWEKIGRELDLTGRP